MQAITTKYFGPTNTRPGRIKATCQAGSVTLSYDHDLNTETNHARVARCLAAHLGWTGEWHSGAMPDGTGYCFVRELQYDAPWVVTAHTVEIEFAGIKITRAK